MSQPNTPSEGAQDPSSSINAAAQTYQQQQQQPPMPSAAMPDSTRDVVMSDSTPDRPASPAIAMGATNVPSPVPARIGTPSRNTNGDATSRATSQHPDSAPTIPKEAPPHGAPTRQYLNGKVTGTKGPFARVGRISFAEIKGDRRDMRKVSLGSKVTQSTGDHERLATLVEFKSNSGLFYAGQA
ncbi:hypothetical protein LOCC1_G000754 [Lachnellula occidentalis]|uniref:Uncharacterized protein n=1 Tax=Lachnellula occidentalis TaxID=215460 RepID=A0A8H8S7M4_9HELO|nr:hypothetical protein LOCC1_G000754 [Lachnellula occidentalis]